MSSHFDNFDSARARAVEWANYVGRRTYVTKATNGYMVLLYNPADESLVKYVARPNTEANYLAHARAWSSSGIN